MKKINSGLRTRQKAYVHTKKINGNHHSLVYTRNMRIALKVRSDLQLRLRTFFAIHLRATRAEFAPENIVIVAGINELKSCFVLHHLIILVYTKTALQLSVRG